MKRFYCSMIVMLFSVIAFAGSPIKVSNGKTSFLKESAKACVTFDWSAAKWDNGKTLKEHWGNNYEMLIKAGAESFIKGFDAVSKKLKTSDAEGKYLFDIKITNVDEFFSAMSVVPGHKHKVWATIDVIEKANNNKVCEIKVESFKGGRDFSIDDSFKECMSDLGKSIAKL